MAVYLTESFDMKNFPTLPQNPVINEIHSDNCAKKHAIIDHFWLIDGTASYQCK